MTGQHSEAKAKVAQQKRSKSSHICERWSHRMFPGLEKPPQPSSKQPTYSDEWIRSRSGANQRRSVTGVCVLWNIKSAALTATTGSPVSMTTHKHTHAHTHTHTHVLRFFPAVHVLSSSQQL